MIFARCQVEVEELQDDNGKRDKRKLFQFTRILIYGKRLQRWDKF